MMDSEFLRALSALENPIEFAARDGFERLERVKGLENTLARAAGHARGRGREGVQGIEAGLGTLRTDRPKD